MSNLCAYGCGQEFEAPRRGRSTAKGHKTCYDAFRSQLRPTASGAYAPPVSFEPQSVTFAPGPVGRPLSDPRNDPKNNKRRQDDGFLNPVRVGVIDIETNSLNAGFGVLLCVVGKTYAPNERRIFRADEFEPWQRGERANDRDLLCAVLDWMEDLDIVIAHNGLRFDLPFLRTRAVVHGLPPVNFQKIIDPVQLARQHFRFPSNSLNSISHVIGTQAEKTPLRPETWARATLNGDKAAMDEIVEHCLTPDHRVLTADLRWVPLGDVQVGDRLIAFDEEPVGDALSGRKWRSSVVESTARTTLPVFEVTLSNGDVIKTTADHRWLVGTNECRGWKWLRTDAMRTATAGRFATKVPKLIRTWELANDYESGWLAGLFDGEGTLSPRHHAISFGQRPGVVLDKALRYLTSRAVDFNVRLANAEHHSGLGRKDCRTVHVRGQLPERLALLGTLRPERLIQRVDPDSFGRLERREEIASVVSVVPIGEREVVMLGTSTKTFIADGYPMHNCVADVDVLEEICWKIRGYVKQIDRAGSYR